MKRLICSAAVASALLAATAVPSRAVVCLFGHCGIAWLPFDHTYSFSRATQANGLCDEQGY